VSRIGRKPVAIPSGVTVKIESSSVTVKGPKGQLTVDIVDHVSMSQEDSVVVVARHGETRVARANHGLMRALLNNMVVGVTVGFKKQLEIKGIGYRADVKGSNLVLNLGYSHLIEYPIPSDVSIEADRNNNITVTGIDKARVGQVAANIRDFRKPDRYKGKGVRYMGEHIVLKAGKSA
jgi:large subunit ribosomal protein L6